MPRRKALKTGVPWVQLSTTKDDWNKADPELLIGMLVQLHLIRAFEEAVLELASEGLVHGPAHASIGQEGGAVGSIIGLRSSDGVAGSHRGHHQFLAKALGHVSPSHLTLEDPIPDIAQQLLQRTLAEILGLAQGFSGGRGGSMHLQWLEAGALGTNAIVGGGVPFAAGNAWAQKHAGTSDATIAYFGDGSAQIGSVLETFNLAAAWKLPIAFFIENNLYAVSTNIEEVVADNRLSVRGQGFGIPCWKADGMDPLAVHLATQEALEMMRAGGGPAVIEVDVYRFLHQNGSYPGSAFGYRSKEEEADWRARDPLERVAAELKALRALDDEREHGVREAAVAAMRQAIAAIVEDDPDNPDTRRIRPELWPDPGFVDVGIRSDGSELERLSALEPAAHDGEWSQIRFVEAVADVMDRRMDQDARIVVLGEDVHHLNGGTNGATRGLFKKYGPDRVIGTPISENAFTGLGGGIALDGRFRPVVEFMYPDFMWVAADQVFNQIGKARHMFGGDNTLPLVLRTKVAMGSGYGSQHLMDPAGLFATSPGWRIVAPSSAADYVGLMNAALALNDPVLVIEHVDLYSMDDQIPSDNLDYVIPPGSAVVRRAGNELTVLSYLSMVHRCVEAIEESGVDAELIDLRWLDRASFDWETVAESVRKTNAVVIVEQGARGTSYGSWLADEIQRRLFDWLDLPVNRVTGGEASPSISKVLERAAIASTEEVAARPVGRSKRKGGPLMAQIVRMPSVMANATDAVLSEWLASPGDSITVGDPLVEIETDKAVVEYAAEVEGTIGRLLVPPGTTVVVGDPIAVVLEEGEDVSAVSDDLNERADPTLPEGEPPAAVPAIGADRSPASSPSRPAGGHVPSPERPEGRLFVTPIARRIATQRGIDLTLLDGTGPNGRIVRHDVEAYRAAPTVVATTADSSSIAGEFRDVPLTGMRRAIAERLTASKTTIPHFYVTAHVRADRLLALRREINSVAPRKISVNDFVIKAVGAAMLEVPAANAIWNGDSIRYFESVDLAVAVAVPNGLLTPVIRGVQRLGLNDLSAQLAQVAEAARAGRLQQHQLDGGSFAVSNLGMYGVTEFSAIINPPQAGILAVSAAKPQPAVGDDGQLTIATLMTVTLSVDHRVIDGAVAAEWIAALVAALENPVRLLL